MKLKVKVSISLGFKILLGLIYCSPVLIAILFSFFSNADILSLPIKFIAPVTFKNFQYVFENVKFLTYLKNTVMMLIIIIPVQIIVGSLSAFVFSFYEFPGRNFLFTVFVTAMVIPGEVNLIANFMTVQSLGLMDTYVGMTIVSLVNVSGMFMLRQHMLTLPASLWESAKLDGCSEMKYFVKIVLPLSRSIIVAQVLNSFIAVYNQYLWPMMVTSSEKMHTVQTGIALLVRDMYWNPGGALAGAVLCMLIPIVVYVIGLDQIVGGLTTGAVKS